MDRKSTLVGIGVIIVAVLFLLYEISAFHFGVIAKPPSFLKSSPFFQSINKYWIIGDIFVFIIGIALLMKGLSD